MNNIKSNLKEVNMRKVLVLVSIVVIACSLTALAKATYNFETADQDSVFIPHQDYFTIYERTSNKVHEGSYAMMYVLDDTSAAGTGGTTWWIRTADSLDLLFEDLEFMIDTIFFWMYLPDVGSGVINFVQPYTQCSLWRWHGAYQSYSSASLDQWDCYPVVINNLDWRDSVRQLPLKRAGVEFGTTVSQPGCTVYIDLVSSESRGAGIELITDPDKVTLEASINTIKFSLAEPTPVLLSVYNLIGAKVAEIAPGVMSAGPHEVAINVSAGLYIVKIVAGGVKKTSKLIVL